MPMNINHVALWCKDLECMKQFYQRYFNAQCNDIYRNERKGFSSYFLSFGDGARLEIMHSEQLNDDKAVHPTAGYAHLAFSTGSEANVDSLTAELELQGYRRIDGPRTTGDGYYESVVLDPEGNRIEITV